MEDSMRGSKAAVPGLVHRPGATPSSSPSLVGAAIRCFRQYAKEQTQRLVQEATAARRLHAAAQTPPKLTSDGGAKTTSGGQTTKRHHVKAAALALSPSPATATLTTPSDRPRPFYTSSKGLLSGKATPAPAPADHFSSAFLTGIPADDDGTAAHGTLTPQPQRHNAVVVILPATEEGEGELSSRANGDTIVGSPSTVPHDSPSSSSPAATPRGAAPPCGWGGLPEDASYEAECRRIDDALAAAGASKPPALPAFYLRHLNPLSDDLLRHLCHTTKTYHLSLGVKDVATLDDTHLMLRHRITTHGEAAIDLKTFTKIARRTVRAVERRQAQREAKERLRREKRQREMEQQARRQRLQVAGGGCLEVLGGEEDEEGERYAGDSAGGGGGKHSYDSITESSSCDTSITTTSSDSSSNSSSSTSSSSSSFYAPPPPPHVLLMPLRTPPHLNFTPPRQHHSSGSVITVNSIHSSSASLHSKVDGGSTTSASSTSSTSSSEEEKGKDPCPPTTIDTPSPAPFLSYGAGPRLPPLPPPQQMAKPLDPLYVPGVVPFPRLSATLFLTSCTSRPLPVVLHQQQQQVQEGGRKAPVQHLCQNYALAVSRIKSEVELRMWDANSDGRLSEHEMENYVREMVPHMEALRELTEDVLPFYCCTVSRRIFWDLDTANRSTISIDALLQSEVLNEWLRLQLLPDDHPRSWFGAVVTRQLYEKFRLLDSRDVGTLRVDDLKRYKKGIPTVVDDGLPLDVSPLSSLFVERYFETTVMMAKSEMDFRKFVDFVIAIEMLPQCSRPLFFWNLLDLEGYGVLTPMTVNSFFRETHAKVETTVAGAPARETVIQELFDLMGTAETLLITREEFLQSPQAGLFTAIVIDCLSFWGYENRASK